MGNYLYCAACIVSALAISNQRKIKRDQSHCPVIEMSKGDVEEKILGKLLVMPPDTETSFKTWWRSVPSSTMVGVRYPYQRHGNPGQTSHLAKTSSWMTFCCLSAQWPILLDQRLILSPNSQQFRCQSKVFLTLQNV